MDELLDPTTDTLVVLHRRELDHALAPSRIRENPSYVPVATLAVQGTELVAELERAFTATNSIDQAWTKTGEARPEVGIARSTSVGDIVVVARHGVAKSAHAVAPCGWTELAAVPIYALRDEKRERAASALADLTTSQPRHRAALATMHKKLDADGNLRLWVHRNDMLERPQGKLIAMLEHFGDAIDQPVHAKSGDTYTATGRRAYGANGFDTLRDTFGSGTLRRLHFDGLMIASRIKDRPELAETLAGMLDLDAMRETERAVKAPNRRSKPDAGRSQAL